MQNPETVKHKVHMPEAPIMQPMLPSKDDR